MREIIYVKYVGKHFFSFLLIPRYISDLIVDFAVYTLIYDTILFYNKFILSSVYRLKYIAFNIKLFYSLLNKNILDKNKICFTMATIS